MGQISNTEELRQRLTDEVTLGAAEGSIERQEAEGQRELLHSDSLPTDGSDNPAIAALGFTFGEPDSADPMFRPATLPDGWRREGSDHSMWSYIVDADGYRRVGIFYKAAFYDRSASMSIQGTPATGAQSDAYRTAEKAAGAERSDGYSEPFWTLGTQRRDGADLIYQWTGCKGETRAEADGDVHAHSKRPNAWAADGRVVEVKVAPDGTIVGVEHSTAA